MVLVTAHAKDDLGKGDFEDIMANRMLSGPGSYLEKPVTAETYVNSIKRALGMDVSEASPPKTAVRDEIENLLDRADPNKMDEILKMLKNNPS